MTTDSSVFSEDFVREMDERKLELAGQELDRKIAHLGSLIKMFREREHLDTFAELAEAAGVDAKIIYKLEEGLLPAEELTQELLAAIGRPLRLTVVMMAASGGFQVTEIRKDTDNASWRTRARRRES